MQTLQNQKPSVLSPTLEAARLSVAKKWRQAFLLMGLINVPIILVVLRYVATRDPSFLVGLITELTAIIVCTTIGMRFARIYIDKTSKTEGYVCPNCQKSLFQPTQRDARKPETTGQCPSCQQRLPGSVGRSALDGLLPQQQKNLKWRQVFRVLAALLVVGAAFMRYAGADYAHDRLALKALQRNDFGQAVQEADLQLRTHPRDDTALAYRGLAHQKQHLNEVALDDFNSALEYSSTNALALVGKCEVESEAESYTAALKDCSHAIDLLPKSVLSYLSRAAVYDAKGMHAEAVKDISAAIPTMPHKEIGYALRGAVYVEDEQHDLAKKDFETAAALDANSLGLAVGRGTLEFLQGDYASASTDLEQAVKQVPTDWFSTAWLQIARFHAGQKDMEETGEAREDGHWPSAVVDMFAGRATIDDVRAQAGKAEPDVAALQSCDADYYIGEYQLQQNEIEAAKKSLLLAVASCPDYRSAEKQAARAEIKSQGFDR